MSSLADFAADFLACLRFYTRLPVRVLGFETAPHELRDFGRAIRATPLAGATIGCVGVLILILCRGAGVPAGVSAALTLGALILTTGVFHEDGLADTMDGFGGGATRERKLEIMRDSRIGSYGATALVLSLLIRWAALDAMLQHGGFRAAAGLVAAHAVSRTSGLLPLALLEPAREDGAAFAAARPHKNTLATAWMIAFAIGLLPLVAGVPAGQTLMAMLAAVAAGLAMTEIARRQIGGQTGDVAGAAQQLAEMAMLCVFSAAI